MQLFRQYYIQRSERSLHIFLDSFFSLPSPHTSFVLYVYIVRAVIRHEYPIIRRPHRPRRKWVLGRCSTHTPNCIPWAHVHTNVFSHARWSVCVPRDALAVSERALRTVLPHGSILPIHVRCIQQSLRTGNNNRRGTSARTESCHVDSKTIQSPSLT